MNQLAPGVIRLTFGTPESDTPSKQTYVKPPRYEALRALPGAAAPFGEEAIRFRVSARGCRLELPLSPGEDIYGLGLNLKRLRHTGKKRTLRVNSDPATDTGDSHAPCPVYFSTAGYGVLVDTARYASFYCGGNEPLDAEESGGGEGEIRLTEAELYAGQKNAAAPMVIDVPAAQGVDLYLFTGPTLLDAVRRYVLFSGGGAFPPEWGLGCHYRACGTSNAEQVLALAAELRMKRIPCDILGLEPGWQTRAYSCSYLWSPERFPDPDGFIAKLRDQDFHINLWEHVFTHPDAPFYREMRPYSGDFKVWKGLVPDFTLAPARDLFRNDHATRLTGKGISGFKLDECDNSDFISSPWSFPECSFFPSGHDGETMHSMLGAHYMDVVGNACRDAGIRTYGLVRNAHAFSSPQPFVLYSDLYDHAEFIRGVTTCGFSGLLWTPEFRHAVSAEDYVRRLQSMVLSPLMLLNIWMMPNPPWRQLVREKNVKNEFYPPEEQSRLETLTREALELRMRFLPYLYAAFAAYHFEGTPPCRALAMDYPEDERLRDVDYAWLAGDRLLVAPFRAGMTELVLPLPPGVWRNFHTGERYEGEAKLTPALGELPILVKENSVIPLADPMEHVSGETRYHLTLRIFGDSPKPARLFADDGWSFGFERTGPSWGELRADGAMSDILETRYAIRKIERF